MSQQKPNVIQRAYTLRLRGKDPTEHSWRDSVWQTHEAVNKGAKAFGDWLLTLRGGLAHTLVEEDLIEDQRKYRRILLALSWLSVESRIGAPEEFIIAYGTDGGEERKEKVLVRLGEILKGRNVDESLIGEWLNDCRPSLGAAIREDAVWVDRSAAFDKSVALIGPSLTREETWDMLECFFGGKSSYFAIARVSDEDSSESEQDEADGKDGKKAKKEDKGGKNLAQNAGGWLSSRFGSGEGADFVRMAEVYESIAKWAGSYSSDGSGADAIKRLAEYLAKFSPKPNDIDGVLGLISGPGYKSATRNSLKRLSTQTAVIESDLKSLEESAIKDRDHCRKRSGSKGRRDYSDTILKSVEAVCGLTYSKGVPDKEKQSGGRAKHAEFSVMLDHAARRVSVAHSWIKRNESERCKFETEVTRKANISNEAIKWLDNFCRERSRTSGAIEPYRIRRRAVDGWSNLTARWQNCTTTAERITAARELQDDPDLEKFGDIQLFEALAGDDALCVWRSNDGKVVPQQLIDYANASDAEFKKRHFKVPAYRHPDPFLHPIFCDFGDSRWNISFGVHKTRETATPRELCMELWTGKELQQVSLQWQSKRLWRDLALGQNPRDEVQIEVARAERFGRAASGATNRGVVQILGLFEQKHWNGRLQAPRQQLKAIAQVRDDLSLSAEERERRMRDMKYRIRWLITFSANLRPTGPWRKLAEKNSLPIDPQYWPHANANKKRKSHAKLILSRIPGLRILSVDLGHRCAAACAVWEAVSAEQVAQACQIAGWKEPTESALYLHLKRRATENISSNQGSSERTVIYRRIAADTLSDGTRHPAPWARLDRQFMIKLQGEEEGVRAVSNEEIWHVHQLECELGRNFPIIDRLLNSGWGRSRSQEVRLNALRSMGWIPANKSLGFYDAEKGDFRKQSLSVDEVMFSTVELMRLGLKRHSDRAHIAFAMTSEYKQLPGDRKYYFSEPEGLPAQDNKTSRDDEHVEFIQEALMVWHSLAFSRGWRDEMAKQLWEDIIAKLPGYTALDEIGEASSRLERRNKHDNNSKKLAAVAKVLVQDVTLRVALNDIWKKRWHSDDERITKQLRGVKDWILPRGKGAFDPGIRKVGGLSLLRIATLTEFRRKVQVGFFTRLRPDGTRAEIKEGFGQNTLNALDHLRKQRVRQLSSRIIEAALGIGRVKQSEGGKSQKRPTSIIDEPCHAIVIESLSHYRPEETRTRRENRQLMSWSSAKVRQCLEEACQLHCLHLREVSASYTSRQDSRTGAPGIRCQDVPIREFLQSKFWRKQIGWAAKKRADGKGSARHRFICDVREKLDDASEADLNKMNIVRIPLQGGEIFVSADPSSPAAKGLQADLNAAANIGLRALTDPDWAGKWWYVPCDPTSFQPAKSKVEGSSVVKTDVALRRAIAAKSVDSAKVKVKSGKKGADKTKQLINLWRDISSDPLDSAESGEWKTHSSYQNDLQMRVIKILMGQIKVPDKQLSDGSTGDDLPF